MAVASYWLMGEDDKAACLYKHIENIPNCLLQSSDPLPKAVLTSFIARIMYAKRDGKNCNKNILRQCEIAGLQLEDSLNYSSCKQQNSLVLVSSDFLVFIFFNWEFYTIL